MTEETNNQGERNSALDEWLSRKKKSSGVKGIQPMPDHEAQVLSHGQQRLWLLDKLYPNSPLYSYAHRYQIQGSIDLGQLVESFQVLAQRHEVVRANYSQNDDNVVQNLNHETLTVLVEDLSDLAIDKQKEKLHLLRQQYISEPFDLSIDPLFRVYITKLGEDRHEVLLVLHHIIGDAWSMGVINTELSAIYQLKLNPEIHPLEPLSVQYKDFAFWQHNQKVKEEDLTYWKQQLSGQLPLLNLPKSSKKSLGNFSGNTHIKLLPSTLANDLKTLSQTLNTTMYVLMVAAYKVLLNKYSRQTDILVGSPVSNRDTKELEKLVGFFNETVVLRTDLSGDPTFSELVATVKRNTLDALVHKNVPFDTLVNEINPQRQTGGNPLFQTMFLYNGLQKPLFLGQEVEVLEEMLDLKVSKFDLTLFVNELPESLELKLEHSIDFEEEFIASMADHFETLLNSLVIKPNQSLSEVSLFSEEGLRDLEKLWFGPKVSLAKVNSIQSLIIDQVNRQPDAKAVIFGNHVLTYAELDLWSDQIADMLTQKVVQRNSFVGLYTDRSLEMVVGILGILKAGGAYLPLDPDYPEERIDFMLSDAQVSIVLSQPEIQERLAVDSDKIVTLQPYDEKVKSEKQTAEYDRTDDFAYVIYTSGSTGKPKGVPVTHGNLIHSTTARFEFYKDEMSSFLLLSSFSFDSSIVGIFWSLCSGGTLVLPPKRIEQDVATLSELIDKHQVSHTLVLPSLYQVLLSFAAPIKLRSLKAVIVAGEACSLSMRNDHFYTLPDTKFYNEYGPTEASVWCIAHEIKREEAATVPIGRPIPNTSSLILDEGQNPVPLGVAGELYIGGSGITNGYLNRGDLTNERFIENPFDKKTTLYRTGDLAKFGIDGVIEFLGRVDQQIKIRGFRVELEEIKNVILQEDGITEAVVDAVEVESGTKKIIAWVQSDVLEIGERVIRRLKTTLPKYMVPSNFEVLDVLPRLPNGKVDRKQLNVTKGGTIKKGVYNAPKDDKEKLLVALWSNVLGLEKVSTTDNFFDIGGDSIRSIEIVAKARQHNLRIGPTQLFEYQTIEALAGNVFFDQNSNKEADTLLIDYPLELPLTYQQEAFLFHSLQGKNDQGFLQLEFRISGEIDLSLMQKAWQRVVECHPIMRTSFYWGDAISQQIIHETAELPLQFVDFSDYNKVAQQDSIEKLKSEDKGQGLNLQEVPCARLTLINLGLDKHLLIWTSHHILIDGWSGAIILKDALSAYHGVCLGNGSIIDSVPNYQQYFNWRSSKNNEAAKLFWQKMLQDANSPMFSDFAKSGPKPSAIYEDVTIHLEEAIGVTLQTIAQEQRLTVNTVLQGLWMITLRNYFANNDITLGLTVSGRASDFDGIDRVTGLFMNVLPLRKQVVAQDLLVTWLGELQQVLNELKNFEYIETDEILSWLKEAEPRQNFDCLFVFGNFMKDRLEIGPLTVEDFTGGFSSTFPLTLRINPLANVEINCRYNTSIVDSESAEWLMKSYEGAIHDLTKTEFSKIKVEDLISERASDSSLQGSGELNRALIEVSASFSGSLNEVQLELSKIWEHVLGVDLIDIHDNYFELGGTSLGALRLFSLIEQRFQRKLSPTVLISRPTISELSELISEGAAGDQEWSSIIPMKTSGTEKPLFCIHSGGAHVLFYQGLARHMDQSRPVYAIQPSGIDGNESYHESIPIMAAHYINEMKKVQPEGPYHLLGTCFGNAVGLEMAHQLKKMGERLTALYIIDSAPAYLQPPSPNGERRPVTRMLSMIKSGNWRGIVKKIKGRYIKLDKRITVDQRNEQQIELDEMIDSLNDLYTKYSWEPIDDNIVLIRSKEFSNRRDKTFHLEQWKKLALGNLETHEIEGHHLTLFDEPEVQGLAKALGTEMSKMESQFTN